ncbi:Splicing factor U2af large subunit B, partial [Frankliniella fusca]
ARRAQKSFPFRLGFRISPKPRTVSCFWLLIYVLQCLQRIPCEFQRDLRLSIFGQISKGYSLCIFSDFDGKKIICLKLTGVVQADSSASPDQPPKVKSSEKRRKKNNAVDRDSNTTKASRQPSWFGTGDGHANH